MRDIILTLAIAALLLSTFKNPAAGPYAWAWISMMNPHKLTYGFANALPFAQAAAAMSLVGLAIAKRRQFIPMNAVSIVLIMMLAWMSLTSFFALAAPQRVEDRWIFVAKIQFMLFITWMLVMDTKQLRMLVWVVTLSVGYFGIKGGIWTVMTGGGMRVWGPPGSLLEGNNELAVALVMLVPFMAWLRQTTPYKWVRWAMTGALVSCFFSILGSQSRGALLSLLAMALFLALKSKRPIASSLGIAVLVGGAIAFMPQNWTSRMETIGTYKTDESAMSRIYTWTTLWNAAVDRPLIGAGFSADTAVVFEKYAPRDAEYEMFRGIVLVAHSIYFQMLGEHGFVGLGLFLLLGLMTWRTCSRIAKRARGDPELESWLPLLMNMTQVSLIGYAIGGAFLSLAYLDLVYYIIGYPVIAEGILRRREKERAATAAAPQAPQPGGTLVRS